MVLEYSTAYLLLGSNMGNREGKLKSAIALLGAQVGEVTAVSALYETAAWGKTDQAPFLNQAIAIKTPLNALQVLEKALAIEESLGRIRAEKWGARLIDIDLILFDSQIINIEGRLQVPHPQMQYRKFVMAPLAEIAPHVVHPVMGIDMQKMDAQVDDLLAVKKIG